MLNMLVIEDNLHYSKIIINKILSENPNMKLYNMLENGKEAMDTLLNGQNKIDIILLDLKLPYYTGLELLDFIEKNNLIKYKNSIIVISGEMDLIMKIKNNSYIYTYINKIWGIDKILKELNKLVELKEKENYNFFIEREILQEFKTLNFQNNLIGTRYLLETILLVEKNPQYYLKDLKNRAYKIIAKKHNVSVNNIKCNINNSTVIMNCNCKKTIVMNYFNFFDEIAEAKPKQVIEEIIKRLYINKKILLK